MEQGEKRNRGLGMLAAALLTGAVVLAVYRVNGIYPFGENYPLLSLTDLEQQYVAYYTYLRDCLLGKGSLLFNWNLGFGQSFWGTVNQYSLLSPLNLLFLLIPRDGLLASMAFFILLKLMLCGVAASWMFQKRFAGLPWYYAGLLGAAYGVSGYALQQCHNVIWLEIVMLLPLLLYAWERLLQGGRMLPLLLLLSAALIINLYITAMVCVFIFFCTVPYIYLFLPRGQRGRSMLRLIMAVCAALLLSAFSTVPTALEMSASFRFGWQWEDYLNLYFQSYQGYSVYKGLALYGLVFAVPLYAWYVPYSFARGRWRKLTFLLFAALLGIVPLFFPNIDTLLHFGGNAGFPYRYGFIPVFMVLTGCGAALSDRRTDGVGPSWAALSRRGKWVRFLLSAGGLLVFLAAVKIGGDNIQQILAYGRDGYAYIVAAGIGACALLLFVLPAGRLQAFLLAVALWAQMTAFGVSYFNPVVIRGEANSDRAFALLSALPENDRISRVQDPTFSLGRNYGLYMDHAAAMSFLSCTPAYQIEALSALGECCWNIGIYDTGGTLLNDALLQKRYVLFPVDAVALDRVEGQPVGGNGAFSVYPNRYWTPFGLTARADLAQIDPTGYADIPSLLNRICTAFYYDGPALFSKLEPDEVTGDPSAGTCTETLRITGGQRLYLVDRLPELETSSVSVFSQGKQMRQIAEFPYIETAGSQDLGEFRDCTVQVTFSGPDALAENRYMLFTLDTALLGEFCLQQQARAADAAATINKRSMTVCGTAQKDGEMLFLPVTWLPGWRCQVDGQPIETCRVLGTFVGVPLEQGTHTVTLTYFPAGMGAGIGLSALGLLLAVGFGLLERRGRTAFAAAPAWLGGTALAIVTLLWAAALLTVYLYPVFHGLYIRFLYECVY